MKKKIYLVLGLFKVKYHTKKKKINKDKSLHSLESKVPYKKKKKIKKTKINHSILHTLNTNFYIKYL